MLTYESRDPKPLSPEKVCDGVSGYYPPVDDFQVESVHCQSSLKLDPHPGPCVGIVVDGKGTINANEVGQGSSFFLPCNSKIQIEGAMKLYIASVNKRIFLK